ncbi:MAG: PilZ domain-containing protein [Candidatus Sericytochromatia bacterium]
MSTVTLLPNQHIKLKRPGEGIEYTVRVMDTRGGTFVVRVPDALVDNTYLESVDLYFGYRNYYFQGPARVRAMYDAWWFIEAPPVEACRTIQRRQFVRVHFQDTLIAIRTNPLGEPISDPIQAAVTNLSAGGCLVRMDLDMKVGDHVLLVLSLPGMPINPIISRVVRRDQTTEQGTGYGLRFESIDERYQDEIAHFIAGYIQAKLADGVDVTQLERP